jgi:inner membrane transporter RhtA
MEIDPDTKPGGSQLLPTLALMASMVSFTSGASFAKRLFPLVGAEGATTLRLVGGLLMLLVLLRPWKALSGTAGLRPVVIYGLAMGGMNLMFYMALSRIPLGIAVAIEFSGPLVVTIASSRAPIDLLWVGLASIGLLLLLPLTGGIHQIDPIGALMALGAGGCWAIYILTGKKAGETHGIAAAALGMGIGALAILPVGIGHAGFALLRPDVLLIGVGVAFLSSALPYSLEMFALRRLQVRTYGTLTSCEPAIGAVAGLLLLGETLVFRQVAGIGLIVVAAAGATS